MIASNGSSPRTCCGDNVFGANPYVSRTQRVHPSSIDAFQGLYVATRGLRPFSPRRMASFVSGLTSVTRRSAASAGMVVFSTRSEEHTLNSSHLVISYAVFCLKKKKRPDHTHETTHRRDA